MFYICSASLKLCLTLLLYRKILEERYSCISTYCRREQQLKTGEKQQSYHQSKKKLRPILNRASRIQKKYHITGASAAARYNLSSSPDSPAAHPTGQAARYNLSSSPDSPAAGTAGQAVRYNLPGSPPERLASPPSWVKQPESASRTEAASAVVVRANPLYDMMAEGVWQEEEGVWRVRALGQSTFHSTFLYLSCFYRTPVFES
jgi:hypothetical protein